MSEEAIVVDGFELLNCIATGSATQIWEVMEQGTSRHFAMKLMLPDAFEDRAERASLKFEAKISAAMDHPNLIQFHDFSVKKPHGYILMDYFRALNLKSQIRVDLPGLQSRIKRVLEGICQGLASLHDQGWVHMDIKPDNILANKSGEVKIIDFSLAKRPGGGMFGGGKKPIRGTRTYLAPETIRRKAVSPATDLYSLGVSIFEIITGNAPFSGMSPDLLLENHLIKTPMPPSKTNENVTPEADALVLKLLQKDPKKRFETAHELYAEIRKINFFKVDPLELKAEAERKKKEEEDASLGSVESRLDSRADAIRVERGLSQVTATGSSLSGRIQPPPAQIANSKTPPESKPAPQTPAPPTPAATPAQAAPVQPAPPQNMPPQNMPPQQMPGQPVHPQYYPPQQYPGQPAGYPPGGQMQPNPNQPMYPPAGQQPYPGMPGAPNPAAGQPPVAPPTQKQPQPPLTQLQLQQQQALEQQALEKAAQQQAIANAARRPVPPPTPLKPADDLPSMDELPPVS